ncbi:hypothetical protein C8R45DRAFT_921479 [Mycena sanguinolenta]|nr:hypothetical protein C8R45DRAFT_921479 [Mycena sanguinolenta]
MACTRSLALLSVLRFQNMEEFHQLAQNVDQYIRLDDYRQLAPIGIRMDTIYHILGYLERFTSLVYLAIGHNGFQSPKVNNEDRIAVEPWKAGDQLVRPWRDVFSTAVPGGRLTVTGRSTLSGNFNHFLVAICFLLASNSVVITSLRKSHRIHVMAFGACANLAGKWLQKPYALHLRHILAGGAI